MSSIDEKRVYGERAGATEVLVASERGVAVVSVSDDLVGEFGMEHQCVARDIATVDGRPIVATNEDVLFGGEFEPTGFGPAVAVTGGENEALAAGEDGRVARLHHVERPADLTWEGVGTVPASVRALDGDLVGTADGVYRVSDGLVQGGLDDVRDVSAPGIPLAATDDGLYRLGNGWMRDADGAFRTVGADPRSETGKLRHAHAATADSLFATGEETGVHDAGEWVSQSVPTDEPIADVGYGNAVYAATEAGTFLANAGEKWRSRSLGLAGVAALAVP